MRLAPALSLLTLGFATAAAQAAPPLHRWIGAAPSRLGASVDGAGDVNGDGRADVVAGAPDASVFDPHVVVRCGATGAVIWAVYDTANGLPGGRNLMTRLGVSVAGTGDLDGDGSPDVVAGAHADGRDAYRSGSVRAYSGSDGRLLWETFGAEATEEFGHRVESAGDVNGDGVDDVVVGALSPLSMRRTVAILSGADGSVLRLLRETAPPDSIGRYTNFGSAVAGVGDLVGDGCPDVAVGASMDDRNGSDAGSVTVFSGRTGAAIRVVLGVAADDFLGQSVDVVGDLNGDGRPEFIAGAPGASSARGVADTGLARVYDGRTGTTLHTFYGDTTDRFLGTDVAGVGDMNRDGYADFAAGTWGYPLTVGEERSDYVEVRSGKTFAVLGRAGSPWFHDGFGAAIAGAGDVNADGFDDIVVGAFQTLVDGREAGRVEVLGGRSQYGIVAAMPGEALGGPRTIVLTGARPLASIALYGGRALGSTVVPPCAPDRALSIRSARLVATARADASGVAVVTLPNGSDPDATTVLLQAIEPETCRLSTLVQFVRP